MDPIEHIAATDLMSEALVAEEENLFLITALNTEQTIRTAHIVDVIGVHVVNGKTPQPGMIKLAEEFGFSLLSTKQSMFEKQHDQRKRPLVKFRRS
jgi:hypothetical protein